MSRNNLVLVWPRRLRLAHWLLVSTVAGAWWTRSSLGDAHLWFGYAAALLALTRIVWGFASDNAFVNFKGFVRPPAEVRAYACQFMKGVPAPHLGHNPLGAYMIVALLGTLLLLGLSGGLYSTDWFWGYGWLADLHAGFGWGLLGLVALHVLGGILSSLKYRENLVAAMVTGKKRQLPPD